MPLIEREDRQPDEKLEVRLRPEVALDLRSYQQFSDSSQHHIISAALKRLFEADKEFKVWQKTNPGAGKDQPATKGAKSRRTKAVAA
jgi:hypothetical protein